MTAKPISMDSRRRGVALIVVLGFLSIMLMMAVAFLTQARVERMVAGASMEGMRTRQMAQTAIAAAMQDYLNALKSVSQTNTEHEIFLSGDNAATISFYYSGEKMGDDRLVIGKAEDWLTKEHLDAATGEGELSDDIQNAEWIWVRQTPRTRSRILGRYAYACFDTSGLIDANLLGTDVMTTFGDDPPTNLWYGGYATDRNNVRKMLFDAVSTSPQKGIDRQYKLSVHQRNWKGFDTPAALLNLTDGDWNDGRNSGANRWIGTDMDEGDGIGVDGLSAYSYSVLHYEDGSGNKKVPCESAEIRPLLDNVQYSSILGPMGVATLLRNVPAAIADYEDADFLSQPDPDTGVATPNYPSVEAVPMFNEIGVQLELLETPSGAGESTYRLRFRLKTEFWCPFPQTNLTTATFTLPALSFGCGGAADGAQEIWARIAAGTNANRATIGLQMGGAANPTPSGDVEVKAKFNDGNPYYREHADGDEVSVEYDVPVVSTSGDPLPSGLYLHVRTVRIKGPIALKYNANIVDMTPSGNMVHTFNVAVGPNTATEWKSEGVNDPRLNHLKESWGPEDPPTMGEINKSAKDARSAVYTQDGLWPGDYFYCRNGAIERPPELGYLPNGRPWETLDIFSEGGVRLMNRVVSDDAAFDILENYKAYFTNGTINPYTRHTNVLSGAFYGVDVREVPQMPGSTNHLTETLLQPIVDAMMLEEVKDGYAGWGKIFTDNIFPDSLNKNKAISIMNNTWGLFNESDRLFVVVVVAQSIKEGEGVGEPGEGNWDPQKDIITGERRAVALCWLDGSADVGGETLTQEMNIIMFQYLNE